jgi:hypothetical protein
MRRGQAPGRGLGRLIKIGSEMDLNEARIIQAPVSVIAHSAL